AEASQAISRSIASAVDPLLSSERRSQPLSRKALWVLASTPGVSSVLNGMRNPSYVEDALEVLRWESLQDPARVYRELNSLRLAR
ncbi:MAG: hypothetical protein ACRD1T_24525, partial [Acidimicrobiia bacterium]